MKKTSFRKIVLSVLFAMLLALPGTYLLPHTFKVKYIAMNSEAEEIVYTSQLGMIKEMKVYNQKKQLTLRGHYVNATFPLYKWKQYGQYIPDLIELYENPELPHWSSWSFVINRDLTVIVEDANQDGIVDKCYTKITPWRI